MCRQKIWEYPKKYITISIKAIQTYWKFTDSTHKIYVGFLLVWTLKILSMNIRVTIARHWWDKRTCTCLTWRLLFSSFFIQPPLWDQIWVDRTRLIPPDIVMSASGLMFHERQILYLKLYTIFLETDFYVTKKLDISFFFQFKNNRKKKVLSKIMVDVIFLLIYLVIMI